MKFFKWLAMPIFLALSGLVSVSSAQTTLLAERFDDGSRTNLSPNTSASWYVSSATATLFTNGTGGANGSLAMDNASSRTLVGYFTAGAPAEIPLGETMTLTITFRVTGAPLIKSNGLVFGLLQSVANPAGLTGAGFTASGVPNTNPRYSGDFGSSNPGTHGFTVYTGYAAWTNLNGTSAGLRKRNGSNDGLDNASAAWTQIGATGGTGTALVANTVYRAILSLNRTAGNAMNLTCALKQGDTTLSTLSVSEPTASYTAFDTVNVYTPGGVLDGAVAAAIVISQVDVVVSDAAAAVGPAFTTHPASQSVVAGDTVVFNAVATGTAPLSYQWKKGVDVIGGVSGPTYTINGVQVADAGSYTVVVSNSVSSVTSNPAVLTVSSSNLPPAITTHPASITVGQGTAANFSVVATGTPPLSYQWKRNGNTIDGATDASFSIASAQPSHEGDYTVVVTNASTFATSNAATLTVIQPPVIGASPAGQTVNTGDAVNLAVSATGAGTLSYQWRKNTNAIPGATNPTFAIASAVFADGASYDVVVTNLGGSATSGAALLAVNSKPLINTPPASKTGLTDGTVTFAVDAVGTPTLSYQWRKGGSPIPGATDPSLTLNNLQSAHAGSYDVVVTNAFGDAVSATAVLTVTVGLPYSSFNLYGFGRLTTGGGVIPESDPAYRKVSTPLEFATALRDSNKTAGLVKVIEIMNDLNLGWNEVGADARNLSSTPFRAHATPKLHPTLIVSGVTLIDIKAKSGLTIFSAGGATIKHACFNIKSTTNIIVRNLRFDEMWEWDEASKGDYDSNNWDFLTLGDAGTVQDIWVDHCTFTKSYDGICDIKGGSSNITFSWNHYVGDDGATNLNSPVRRQIAALEANKTAYPFYNFLRTNGFSAEEIVLIVQGHDKTHLMGSNSIDPENNNLSATFHHQWHLNPWDRLPRLRGGNVHNYNLYVDDTLGRQAKRLRDARANAMSVSAKNAINSTYSFNPFLNGSISTESGRILVDKSVYLDCLTPLRNNQTNPSLAVYTGKIKAFDTICRMTDDNNVSSTVRGDSTDAGNPMGPFQATIIPWTAADSVMPYAPPPMDDPANLALILQAGAGAGKISWPKQNWLVTSYAAERPVVLTPPVSLTREVGLSATFSVLAVGPATLGYQWKKGDDEIPGATGPSLTLDNVQIANAGVYTVVVTNGVGSVTSAPATLTVTQSFAAWMGGYGLAGDRVAFAADNDGDGLSNGFEFGVGTRPDVVTTEGLPLLGVENGQFVFRYTRPSWAGGIVYVVQTSSDLATWVNEPGLPTLESSNGAMQTWVMTFPGRIAPLFVRLSIALP